jgi:hypothetical protein
MTNEAINIPIQLKTRHGLEIRNHPVEFGVPFPRGAVAALAHVSLFSCDGAPVPCEWTEILRWPDESIRWGALRFMATGDSFFLRSVPDDFSQVESTIQISSCERERHVDTGAVSFVLATDCFALRSDSGISMSPDLLKDARGRSYRFQIESWEMERSGAVSATFLLKGRFVSRRNRSFCNGECRISFWANTALIRIEFTLWNPNAARHRGGLWDLGDPRSVYFRSLHFSFNFPGDSYQPQSLYLSVEPGGDLIQSQSESLSIHQSSSGGPTWQNLAHVDRNNIPTPKFKGYRQFCGQSMTMGIRANPAVICKNSVISAAFALEDFWQRFPSRLEIQPGGVSIEPFPSADCQDFELQGGEKVTFRLWADFDCRNEAAALLPARIDVIPVLPADWHRCAQSISGLSCNGKATDPWIVDYMQTAVEGPHSFFDRRESFDEYGWRNFGDLPADHELLHFKQNRQFVSHYNNQYDLVQGFLTQFALTSDSRWFELARDLARHVIDHDIYHTVNDKSAYNGGYFWHTAHYLHAGTATHRSFSRLASDPLPRGFGGGPADEHNYTTGLAYYYLMSGDVRAKEVVVQLATWVRNMQDGWKTRFKYLSRNETGLATGTASLLFQGPGRGSGYSINACLDAFALTSDRQWLSTADHFLGICIHPADDPAGMGLLDREGRWSYVVFLQVLGKYLDLRMEIDEPGREFHFARESMLTYARWMAEAEYPYLDHPEELEYPTSTWAAQELRKACVFLFAAKYGPPNEQALFAEKADYFFSRGRQYLESFEDKASTRNMAIVLLTAPSYLQLKETAKKTSNTSAAAYEFEPRIKLFPQKLDAMRKFKRIVKTCGLYGIVELCRYALDCFSASRKRR